MDAGVVAALLNGAVLVEHDGVVVLDARVLLVGHLHLPVGKRVDLVLLQVGVVKVSLLVEKCGLDLSARDVDQLDI